MSISSSPTSSTSPGKLPNRNIKERLNLHVKRRLQETETAAAANGTPQTPPISVGCKRGAHSDRNTTLSGRGGKKTKGTKHAVPAVASSSTTYPDDECSRDSCTDVNREKDHSPDILTVVLNNKKLSLLQDPEVKKFLENIVGIIGK